MKSNYKNIWTAAVAVVLLTLASPSFAGDFGKFIDSFTAAPVAALKTADLKGESTFGTGVDLGVGINKFVSIHVTGLTYETDDWRSSAIDESEAYVSADLTRFAKDAFIVSLKGGAVTDWNEGDYGLGVGVGARIQFTQSLSLGADYTVRAWFDGPSNKDSLARLFFQYKI